MSTSTIDPSLSCSPFISIYFVENERDEVSSFFQMLESPDTIGKNEVFSFHDSLKVEENVKVRVPSAVTQKLKITCIEEVDGKQSKWAPYIELPRSELKEKESALEYQNVQLLLVAHYNGRNFSFPIERCMGQKGSTREEENTVKHFPHSKIVFFSRARMPNFPIKKKLKLYGIHHLSCFFMVNGQVVPDDCERRVVIATDSSLGAGMCRSIKRANKRQRR